MTDQLRKPRAHEVTVRNMVPLAGGQWRTTYERTIRCGTTKKGTR